MTMITHRTISLFTAHIWPPIARLFTWIMFGLACIFGVYLTALVIGVLVAIVGPAGSTAIDNTMYYFAHGPEIDASPHKADIEAVCRSNVYGAAAIQTCRLDMTRRLAADDQKRQSDAIYSQLKKR